MHAICFPGEAPEDEDATVDDGETRRGPKQETDAEFWDRVTACHEEEEVRWFMLFEDEEHEARGASKEGHRLPGGGSSELIGFAAAVPYAQSVYGMHLAVVPSRRGRGHGAWLMREVQAWALATMGVTRVQASVEADRARLLRYYEKLGARVVPTGIGSGGSAAATVVRIARDFDAATATAELEASRRRGVASFERPSTLNLAARMIRGGIRALEAAAEVGLGRIAGRKKGAAAGNRTRDAAVAAMGALAAGAVVVALVRRGARVPAAPAHVVW